MAIAYSGLTISNTTFTQATGTRREIVDGIAAALLAAGWSQISGAGTADQVLKSATTPQGLAIRIRLLDPGSGNCAQAFLHNATGSLTQTANQAYLLPAAAQIWRFIGNAYQFFCFVDGSTAANARNYVAAGVPWIPSFLSGSVTAAGWMQSSSTSDTDTSTARIHFRTRLDSSGSGNVCNLYNGNIWAQNGLTGQYLCAPVSAYGPSFQSSYSGGSRWADNSAQICDPLIAWALTAFGAEIQIVGMLWDACIITDSFVQATTSAFDSHNWYNLTNSNAGSSQITKGSLFLVVP